MSPEQATGDRAIDGRTDIYSLGRGDCTRCSPASRRTRGTTRAGDHREADDDRAAAGAHAAAAACRRTSRWRWSAGWRSCPRIAWLGEGVRRALANASFTTQRPASRRRSRRTARRAAAGTLGARCRGARSPLRWRMAGIAHRAAAGVALRIELDSAEALISISRNGDGSRSRPTDRRSSTSADPGTG